MFGKNLLINGLGALLLAALLPSLICAQDAPTTGDSFLGAAAPEFTSEASADQTPPAGTRITTENWQQYRQFMSEGVQALFAGKYFWKMPADVEIGIGPTQINPPPRNFLDATEKFSGQVKLLDLPNGGLTLQNYQGGFPFPNPADPHKGWKILANLWYRYFPHASVIIHGGG